MTRGRASHPERDLHELFRSWLQDGAAGDPPRDAAVHAAHCVRCRAGMTALDHLSLVDVGRAPMPPSRGEAPDRSGLLARPRLVAAAASGFVVVAAAAWIGIGAFAPNLLDPGTAGPSADQEVLGGFGAGGSVTADPSAAVSFGGVTTESDGATPNPGSPTAEATVPASHVFTATPPPTAIQPPSSPPPSSAQTAAPTARESQGASATAPPTPTSEPTPEPTPFGACDDGIDNDGDGFTDLLDPGCALGNEFAA